MEYKESFVENKTVFNIIMDYCEDGDLYKKIRAESESMEEERILDYTSQILIALEYIHSCKILHRDLKTQNIFISRSRLFLGDFGISKRLDNTQDLTNTYIGKSIFDQRNGFNMIGLSALGKLQNNDHLNAIINIIIIIILNYLSSDLLKHTPLNIANP